MIIGVVSHKGGVGKTTSAVHLAAWLSAKGPALLIDGDANRSASGWAERGEMPFKVVSERQAAKYAADFPHKIIDTAGHLPNSDLRELAEGCDLLIVCCTPDALSLDALLLSADTLQKIGSENFKILLTMCNPVLGCSFQKSVSPELPSLTVRCKGLVRFSSLPLSAGLGIDNKGFMSRPTLENCTHLLRYFPAADYFSEDLEEYKSAQLCAIAPDLPGSEAIKFSVKKPNSQSFH
ncbi:MAG: AAA family ATPase [Burkholderiales bacterium]